MTGILTPQEIAVLRLSVPSQLSGPHGVVDAILTYSVDAPDTELPGLVAALETVLSATEQPAAQLIAQARAEVGG